MSEPIYNDEFQKEDFEEAAAMYFRDDEEEEDWHFYDFLDELGGFGFFADVK